MGLLDPILGTVESQIEQIVMSDIETFGELLDEFEVSLERQVKEAREKERTLADFAMDRASLRRDVANALLEGSPLARSADLSDYADAALDYFGGTSMEHPEGGVVLSLSPRLATRLKTRASSVRGVFVPADALRLEDVDFFAFGHPLIDGLVDLPLSVDADFQPIVTGVRKSQDVEGLSLEVFYEIRVGGLRPAGRIIRHVVGDNLEVRSEDLSGPIQAHGAPGTEEQVPAWIAAAVAASRGAFTTTVGEVRRVASKETEEIKSAETLREQRIFEYRRVRLDALVDDQERRIDEVRTSESEKSKRILPALEGRLTKAQERRDRLTAEHEVALREIASHESSVRPRCSPLVWWFRE